MEADKVNFDTKLLCFYDFFAIFFLLCLNFCIGLLLHCSTVCFSSCICLRLQGKFNAGEVRYSTKSKSFTAIQAEVLLRDDDDNYDDNCDD